MASLLFHFCTYLCPPFSPLSVFCFAQFLLSFVYEFIELERLTKARTWPASARINSNRWRHPFVCEAVENVYKCFWSWEGRGIGYEGNWDEFYGKYGDFLEDFSGNSVEFAFSIEKPRRHSMQILLVLKILIVSRLDWFLPSRLAWQIK
jgi:hypothetical protein